MYAFKLVNYNLEVHTVNIYVNFEKPVRDYIDKMLLKVDISIERCRNI